MTDPDATPLPVPAPPPPQAGCRHGNVAYTLPGATAPMVCSSCSAEALEEGLARVLDRVVRTDDRMGLVVERLPHLALGEEVVRSARVLHEEVERLTRALERLTDAARQRGTTTKRVQVLEALRTEVADLRERVLVAERRRAGVRWRVADLLVQIGGLVRSGRWVRVP